MALFACKIGTSEGSGIIQKLNKTVDYSGAGSQYAASYDVTKTLDFSELENYSDLTDDNFIVGLSKANGYGSSNTYTGSTVKSFSYDASTGTLTVVVTVQARWNGGNPDTASGTIRATCVYNG